MNNPFFKSIVNSLQTASATLNYFSPKPQRQPSHAQHSSPPTSPVDPLETPSRLLAVREMAPQNVAGKQLFKDVVFYDSSSALDESHRNLLLSGGASELDEIPGEGVPWDEVTHVFTRDFDFPGKEGAIQD